MERGTDVIYNTLQSDARLNNKSTQITFKLTKN